MLLDDYAAKYPRPLGLLRLRHPWVIRRLTELRIDHDDANQEIWHAAYLAWPRFDKRKKKLCAWIAAVAYNRCRRLIDSAQRRPKTQRLIGTEAVKSHDTPECPDLSCLPRKHRNIVRHRYLLGTKVEGHCGIASRYKVHKSRVHQILNEALILLRRQHHVEC